MTENKDLQIELIKFLSKNYRENTTLIVVVFRKTAQRMVGT
jgi:hypothetical protein